MENIKKIKVDESQVGKRIDKLLSELYTDYSRSYFQNLVKNNFVTSPQYTPVVNKLKVMKDDEFIIKFQATENKFVHIKPEPLDFDVLYKDKSLIVINKPPGMVVHPAAGNYTGTLVNALLAYDPEFTKSFKSDEVRPGIVHRLDKETSGCLVVARNPSVHYKLAKLFEQRNIEKEYATIVCGIPQKPKARLVSLIGRHPVNRKKMAIVSRNGKQAITEYEVIERFEIEGTPCAFLNVKIMTGRTHQIRVHLANEKIPVLGDKIYGGKQNLEIDRQLLHAWRLSLKHPITGKQMDFEAPFPKDFDEILKSKQIEM